MQKGRQRYSKCWIYEQRYYACCEEVISLNVVSVWSLEVVVCDMIRIMRPLMRRIRPIEMMIIYSHTNTTIGNTIRSLTMETTKRAMSGGEFVLIIHNTRQLNA